MVLATVVLGLAVLQVLLAVWMYRELPLAGCQPRPAGGGAFLAGCFFYGAFVAKVLLVQTRRLPGWALQAAGGTRVQRLVRATLMTSESFTGPPYG